MRSCKKSRGAATIAAVLAAADHCWHRIVADLYASGETR